MENQRSEEIVFTAHPGQAQVLTSVKRIILAIAGIQGGKTFCGCAWMQGEIQKYPDKNHLIGGLSHDQVNNVLVDKFFGMFPAYRNYFNKKEKTIYLPTGGKIFFRSLEDPKYVEGITAHSAWIDEADLAGQKAYTIVRGRLTSTGGRLLMTSSLADNSWLAEYVQRLDDDDVELVNWSSRMNPVFTEKEWESLKRETDPAVFRRRYEGDIHFSSGRVYSHFDKEKHMLEKVPLDDPIEKTFIGIDWGFVDPTAIIVIGLSMKKNIYILDEFVVEGAPLMYICRAILEFKEMYGARIIYADSANKQIIEEVQAKTHSAIIGGKKDIFFGTTLIRNLIFQNRFFTLSKCIWVNKELRQYRFKEGLNYRTEEPEDRNNHTMDAIRYVLATYPIPVVRLKKAEQEKELPEFWLRRTAAYKREKRKAASLLENVIIP